MRVLAVLTSGLGHEASNGESLEQLTPNNVAAEVESLGVGGARGAWILRQLLL